MCFCAFLGAVFVRNPLSREKVATFEIIVSVHDNASDVIDKSVSVPNGKTIFQDETYQCSSLLFLCMSLLNVSLSSLARLTINVLDVNDNAPVFRPRGVESFTEQILEGAHPGTTLLSVSAIDPDKGPNGEVVYELLNLPLGGYVKLEDPFIGTINHTL